MKISISVCTAFVDIILKIKKNIYIQQKEQLNCSKSPLKIGLLYGKSYKT